MKIKTIKINNYKTFYGNEEIIGPTRGSSESAITQRQQTKKSPACLFFETAYNAL